MNEPNPSHAFHLPQMNEQQMTRVIAGMANVVAMMLAAHVEAAGPECGDSLMALRARLVTDIRNHAPLGLPLDEEPAVIETLLTVVEAGFSALVFE